MADFDPHYPMKTWISTLDKSWLRKAGHEEIVGKLTAPLLQLYMKYCRGDIADPRGFPDYLRRLESTPPGREDLEQAPEILRWSLVRRPSTATCHLSGYVAGHDRFDWGSPVLTSLVFQIEPGFRWARTASRFYLLSGYDPDMFARMKSDGLIRDDLELVRFD